MNIQKEVTRYKAERRETDLINGTYKRPVKNLVAVKRHTNILIDTYYSLIRYIKGGFWYEVKPHNTRQTHNSKS